jgi:hypothetical protein
VGTTVVIKKQSSIKPSRRKEHRPFDNTEENGNHTEGTQHGPSQIPPNIRARQENGREWSK